MLAWNRLGKSCFISNMIEWGSRRKTSFFLHSTLPRVHSIRITHAHAPHSMMCFQSRNSHNEGIIVVKNVFMLRMKIQLLKIGGARKTKPPSHHIAFQKKKHVFTWAFVTRNIFCSFPNNFTRPALQLKLSTFLQLACAQTMTKISANMFEFDLITHTHTVTHFVEFNLLTHCGVERVGRLPPITRVSDCHHFQWQPLGRKRISWANECIRFTVQMSFAINLSPSGLIPKNRAVYIYLVALPIHPFPCRQRDTFDFAIKKLRMLKFGLVRDKCEVFHSIHRKMRQSNLKWNNFWPYIVLKLVEASIGVATLASNGGIY